MLVVVLASTNYLRSRDRALFKATNMYRPVPSATKQVIDSTTRRLSHLGSMIDSKAYRTWQDVLLSANFDTKAQKTWTVIGIEDLNGCMEVVLH